MWPGAVLRGDDGDDPHRRPHVDPGRHGRSTPRPGSPTTVGDECVVGHLVHLEGCTIHDGALVGSGSVVLHQAVVETGALVGAGAVVPNGMVVPTGAMALGIPAKLATRCGHPRHDRAGAMQSYVERGHRYRKRAPPPRLRRAPDASAAVEPVHGRPRQVAGHHEDHGDGGEAPTRPAEARASDAPASRRRRPTR